MLSVSGGEKMVLLIVLVYRRQHMQQCLSFDLGLQDKKEVIRGVYSIIDQLSRTHLNTLERLIFHLVR